MGTAEGLPFPKPPRRGPKPRQGLRRGSPAAWRARSAEAARARTAAMPDPMGPAVCRLAYRGRCVGGLVRHHIRRRSQAEPEAADTPDNLVWLCAGCHDWVHRNVADARALGLLQ